ncbi:ribosome small subunit-dependent GTPase A [Ramlibacter sp. PS4R-6]|uniref:ribosome small subunit-dependent GTPase A n=1 Tax=Ramlibacter sp. PS4R-6 TaxID=3133438 RepID=UPI0030A63035
MFEHIDFDNLRAIGLTQGIVNRVAQLADTPPNARLARITETQRDTFALHDGLHEGTARRLRHDTQLTVGDWVVVQEDEHGDLWIADVVEPVTQIARRANDGRRQPLASNVDTALLVMGLDADFNPRRMERYLAMVRACDVVPVVVLTKADIAPDARERYADVCRRLPATVPVLAVNALSGQARTEIGPWLHAGQTLVLLGSSGAGKSTLTNTLTDAGQATGGVRSGDGRGRHTTTARSLHLCPQGACIIDTPGLRTWRPDADAETLAATYEDVQSLALQCRFADCRHEGEPGCAVREHVDEDRLQNYHKLLRDAQRVEMGALDRIALRKKWAALGKAGARRSREKRA